LNCRHEDGPGPLSPAFFPPRKIEASSATSVIARPVVSGVGFCVACHTESIASRNWGSVSPAASAAATTGGAITIPAVPAPTISEPAGETIDS
jgi:hypothetical protein